MLMLIDGEGFSDIESFSVEPGSTASSLIALVAAKRGWDANTLVMFAEDHETPVEPAVVIDEAAARRIHHVHRVKEIEVTVFYQGGSRVRGFKPSARVQTVLDWGVGPDGFKIDPAIAPEMELALHGATTALPKSAHIGRFVQHPSHTLALDLIRGVVPNGALG